MSSNMKKKLEIATQALQQIRQDFNMSIHGSPHCYHIANQTLEFIKEIPDYHEGCKGFQFGVDDEEKYITITMTPRFAKALESEVGDMILHDDSKLGRIWDDLHNVLKRRKKRGR